MFSSIRELLPYIICCNSTVHNTIQCFIEGTDIGSQVSMNYKQVSFNTILANLIIALLYRVSLFFSSHFSAIILGGKFAG